MNFTSVQEVNIFYKPMADKIFVGKLAIKNRKIFFEYDSSFLKTRLNLSPFMLPAKAGIITGDDLTFEGLFGVFNDSLPDGWGRLLLDRALMKHGINPGSLSMLDRLCFVGSNGMGALIYEPVIDGLSDKAIESLDTVAEQVYQFQHNDRNEYVEDLLKFCGSSSGVRPKVIIDIEDKIWLIKFPSHIDPKDISAIEYAYHLLAKDAGLDVPESKLFSARKGVGFFGSARFDRIDNTRVHMHTISGLLHADHRTPSLDYHSIMKATMHLTQNINECRKLYRLCVFNILSHNRDDHSKNFSFLMDSQGIWHISPAYDLTFSTGPNGEHCSMIMGEGKNPTMQHLLELARVSDIQRDDAVQIIMEVKSSVSKWSQFAKQAGVSSISSKLINSSIKNIVKSNFD